MPQWRFVNVIAQVTMFYAMRLQFERFILTTQSLASPNVEKPVYIDKQRKLFTFLCFGGKGRRRHKSSRRAGIERVIVVVKLCRFLMLFVFCTYVSRHSDYA